MSRNPAWQTYEETVDKINTEFDKIVKPERKILERRLHEIENDFAPKIMALEVERDTLKKRSKGDFEGKVTLAAAAREKAIKIATEVRNTELKTMADQKKEIEAEEKKSPEGPLTRTSAKSRTVPA